MSELNSVEKEVVRSWSAIRSRGEQPLTGAILTELRMRNIIMGSVTLAEHLERLGRLDQLP